MQKVLSILMICVLCFTLMPSTASAAVKISKKSINLGIGETYDLTIKGTYESPSWSSSNKSVATVSKYGTVTAVGKGSTTITAKIKSKKYKCSVTVKIIEGSIQMPYSAWNSTDINYQEYGEGQKISIQLLEYIDGDKAYSEVMKENEFSDIPDSDQQWVLMKFHIKYISGSDELWLGSVFSYDMFFNESMNKSVHSDGTCAFCGEREGFEPDSIKLFASGESDVWIPMMIEKADGYLTFRLPIGQDSNYNTQYSWFKIKQ